MASACCMMQKRLADAEDRYEAQWANYSEAKVLRWQAEDALHWLHVKMAGNVVQMERAPRFETLPVSMCPFLLRV